MEICQCCGKEIEWGSHVVAVRYGVIKAKVSHTAVTKGHVDYFHKECEKSFRSHL
jgi:hypothetical protein